MLLRYIWCGNDCQCSQTARVGFPAGGNCTPATKVGVESRIANCRQGEAVLSAARAGQRRGWSLSCDRNLEGIAVGSHNELPRSFCLFVFAVVIVPGFPVTLAEEVGIPTLPERNATVGRQKVVGQPVATHHPEHVLVRFKAGTLRAGRQAVHAAARAKGVLVDYHVVGGLQLVQVAEDALPEALAVYRNHPDVLYAEFDYAVCADSPNDPEFDKLWGLYNTGQTVDGDPGTAGADIQALPAWNFWTGDPTFTIAVIDTGVDYEHADLQDNMWTNPDEIPDNGIDDDGNGFIDDIYGYDYYNEDSDPMDDIDHGSHVAGTIGAVANNNKGVVGVNWQCRIMALKFLGGGG